MGKVYEVFIERDKEFPDNEDWVIYSGSRRMVYAFKAGAEFASPLTRRYKIRERKDNGHSLRRKESEEKMVYHPNKVPHSNDGNRG